MHNILAFDVSNNSCSVAISSGRNILSFTQNFAPTLQAEILMIMVESALKQTHINYADIDYLAVTVGPGSFSGIRIGIAAARGILYASNIKGIGITNFEMSFYRLQEQVKHFDSAVIILNAYREQLYIQQFLKSGEKKDPKVIHINNIKCFFESLTGEIACTGNGLYQVYDKIKNLDHLILLPRFSVLQATYLTRYAHEKISSNRNLDAIEPLYIGFPVQCH